MPQIATPPRTLSPALAIPVLALLLVLPLLRHGPSCGHDFGFHVQSWMDAAQQLRRGDLLPRWTFSPAFNAGEPRFTFYPPLSWLLGATLLLTLPASLVPATFTFLALALAGWGMFALARRFTSPAGALLAATLYLVNPYLLFTAFERTAFAELLAAAWFPWLLRAALAARPRPIPIAIPLALLWLTNAPAAVMGTYAFVFLLLLRLLRATPHILQTRPGQLGLDLQLLRPAFMGLALGLALPAFYLLPAAYERRYVQIATAIIPNMRVEDNFLFAHTGFGPHDQVLHTASLVAVSLLALTAVALTAAFLRPTSNPARITLTALAVAVACLLLRPTLPLWHHLPELAFLQFPWRWLAVLGCVFATAAALALGRLRIPTAAALLVSVALAAVASPLAQLPFRQGCETLELPATRLALFRTHHGVGPTDEYTPGDADNDQLRWDDPAFWLTPDPNAPAPNTIPNPAATIPDWDDAPPLSQTITPHAPTHLHLNLPAPTDLVLHLRDYPAWRVTVNNRLPPHLHRDDGLLAIPLPSGPADITLRWHTLPDVWLGDGLSLAALAATAALARRSRKIKPANEC